MLFSIPLLIQFSKIAKLEICSRIVGIIIIIIIVIISIIIIGDGDVVGDGTWLVTTSAQEIAAARFVQL